MHTRTHTIHADAHTHAHTHAYTYAHIYTNMHAYKAMPRYSALGQSPCSPSRTYDHPTCSTIARTHLRTHTLMPTLMQTHSCMQVYYSHVFNCYLEVIYIARDSLVIGLASIWQPQRGTVLLTYDTAVTGRDRQGMNPSLNYVVDEHTIHHMAKLRNVTPSYIRRSVGISKVYICVHTFI